MPDPPATRSKGPPSLASQANQPPIRSPQLQPVADPDLIRQVGRDFTIVKTLDEQFDPAVFRRRGYGAAALGLVAVLGGEPDIDMLASSVTLPARHLQEKLFVRGVSGLVSTTSPIRQASLRGMSAISVAPVALLAPRVSGL